MNLTKIKLHGNLAEQVGRGEWKLKIESISEAVHAIDTISKRKLSKAILNNEKQNIKYRILVNGKEGLSKNIETAEQALDSELMIKKEMKSIDIVPVLEGAWGGAGPEAAGDDTKDWLMVVGGALMLGAGFMMGSPMMMQMGLFMLLTGMANLLAEPPDFEDFREIQQQNKRESYLFNGPINTYNPGGPVPIGYGRMLVGSLSVAFSQENEDKMIYQDGTFYP